MSALAASVRDAGFSLKRLPRGEWGTLLLLTTLIVVDVSIQPALLDVTQIGLLIQTALVAVLLASAQTLAVLTRGVDLSVGSVLVVTDVLTATKLGGLEGDRLALLPLVLAAGAAIGLLNGALIAYGGLEPFVATLATWAIFDGVALLVLPTDGGAPPQQLTNLAIGETAGIPNAYIGLALVLLAWFALRRSPLGVRILAVGSDAERAFLNGIDVRRTKLIVYALGGFVAGIAGVYLAASTSTGVPTAGDGLLLPSLAAVVIGGTSLAGGRGGVGLSVMGVFVLVFIGDLVAALQLPSWVATVASAAMLLIVVSLRSLPQVLARKETA